MLANDLTVSAAQNCTDQFTSNVQYVLLVLGRHVPVGGATR